MKMPKVKNINDPRSFRGIFSRGHARYGRPGNSPKPGNMKNIQAAAKKRLQKMDRRRYR